MITHTDFGHSSYLPFRTFGGGRLKFHWISLSVLTFHLCLCEEQCFWSSTSLLQIRLQIWQK